MTLSNIGHVAPYPDYSVAHKGSQGVMIECRKWQPAENVLNWITAERGGSWKMVEWEINTRQLDGSYMTEKIGNPHKSTHGFWCYLVRPV